MKRLQAIYHAGVLRPVEQLALDEDQVVTLFLAESHDADLIDEFSDIIDDDILATAEREAEGEVSLEELRERLSSIPGSMSDVVIEERGEY